MAEVRKGVTENFTEEELLRMVKENLDKLGIMYEEKPGGFGDSFFLDPGIFEPVNCTESVKIITSVSHRHYRPPNPVSCDLKLSFADTWSEDFFASCAA